jgi:hypothetical protein
MYNWIYDRAGAGAIIAEATGHFKSRTPYTFLPLRIFKIASNSTL